MKTEKYFVLYHEELAEFCEIQTGERAVDSTMSGSPWIL